MNDAYTIHYISLILLNVTTFTGVHSNCAVIYIQIYSKQYFVAVFGILQTLPSKCFCPHDGFNIHRIHNKTRFIDTCF